MARISRPRGRACAVIAACMSAFASSANGQTLYSADSALATPAWDRAANEEGALDPGLPSLAQEWRFAPPTAESPGYIITETGQTYVVSSEAAPYVGTCPPEMSGGAPPAAGGAAAGANDENNGTNPAQNANTAIFQNSYTKLNGGGNQINTSYIRMKFPMYGGRGSYLVEVPFNFYDLETPASGQVGALGDVKFQFSYNAWISPSKRLTFLTFLELYIPSADNVLLTAAPDANEFVALEIGTGKYVLGPGLGIVYALRKSTIFAPLYFYERSVAGDETRQDVDRGKWRIFLMNSWANGVYVLPEVNIVTNYLNGSTDAYIAPEVGLSRKRTTIYCKPGVGVDPGFNERDWGVEFGARVLF